MEIMTDTAGEVRIVRISGNLDTQSYSDAQANLMELIDEGTKKILVNFEELDYISSAGLRILLVVAKKLTSSGGELRICCLNESVKEVFDISGFSGIFHVTTNQSLALEDF